MKPQLLDVWLAALIDGEGSIMLGKRTYSGNQRNIKRRQLHFRAVVSICNTDHRLIDALVQRTGIERVYRHRVGGDPRTPRKRSMWTWRLANDDIRKWLPRVRPHLILKQKQADLLLEALSIKQQITPGNEGFLPKNRIGLTNRLKEIYEEIRKLNTTGRTVGVADVR